MANTHNRGASENNNNNANPPPPPTVEQVLIMHAQMLKTVQQTMANMQQSQGHQPTPQPQPHDKLGEFQRTKPPTFSHSIEPMDADDWLKTIEKKLQVVQCNNREKVLFASHQLEGPAAGLVGCLCRSPRGAKKHQRARVQKQLQVSSCATQSDEAQEIFFKI
jgi:hypothetical protein